jgi:hypothetical protein
VYSLNFEMMTEVLQQFRPTGEFRAYVSPQAALKEGGQAVLIVHNGTITSCFILDRAGRKIYHDEETGRLLSRLGVLDWQLAPSTSTASEPMKNASSASVSTAKLVSTRIFYPRHLPVPLSQMRTWTILQRSVYGLADGTRHIEQIAALLSRPSHTIERIVRDLQKIHAIE